MLKIVDRLILRVHRQFTAHSRQLPDFAQLPESVSGHISRLPARRVVTIAAVTVLITFGGVEVGQMIVPEPPSPVESMPDTPGSPKFVPDK